MSNCNEVEARANNYENKKIHLFLFIRYYSGLPNNSVALLFTFEEISKLKDHFETHEDIQKHAYGRSDGNNRMSKLCIWNKAGDDLSGIVAR